MFYLYVKTHNITGRKYLGYTSKDPMKYHGSGLRWKSHLKKHGNDVTTEILAECETKHDVRRLGEYYSDFYNVVEDENWSNLKPETGDGGSPPGTNLGRKHTDKTKRLISERTKGKPKPANSRSRTEAEKEHLRQVNLGKKLSVETVEKMRQRMLEFTHSNESKAKMRKPKSLVARQNMTVAQQQRRKAEEKKVWITDGQENQLWPENEKIPKGWTIGRTIDTVPPSQKGKFWINNGSNSRMATSIPDGWKKGRIYKRKV